MENIAKPTKQQLDWHELELGVLIHYCLEMYRPELPVDVKMHSVESAMRRKSVSSAFASSVVDSAAAAEAVVSVSTVEGVDADAASSLGKVPHPAKTHTVQLKADNNANIFFSSADPSD